MSAKHMGQVFDLTLPRSAKSVLLALADHADHEGNNAYPGVSLLAYKTELSERQVQRCLGYLSDQGLISADSNADGGRGKKPSYSLHLEKGDKKAPFSKWVKEQPVKGDILTPIDSVKGDIDDSKRVTLTTPKGDIDDSSSYSLYEPSEEPSSEPKKERVNAPAISEKSGGLNAAEKSEAEKSETAPGYDPDMLVFWEVYPAPGRARGTKLETQAEWRKLTAAEKRAARTGLECALRVAQFREFPKAPHRWLRAKSWETFTDNLPGELAAPVISAPSTQSALGAGSAERAERFKTLRNRT